MITIIIIVVAVVVVIVYLFIVFVIIILLTLGCRHIPGVCCRRTDCKMVSSKRKLTTIFVLPRSIYSGHHCAVYQRINASSFLRSNCRLHFCRARLLVSQGSHSRPHPCLEIRTVHKTYPSTYLQPASNSFLRLLSTP